MLKNLLIGINVNQGNRDSFSRVNGWIDLNNIRARQFDSNFYRIFRSLRLPLDAVELIDFHETSIPQYLYFIFVCYYITRSSDG